jgi:hypothetical protein
MTRPFVRKRRALAVSLGLAAATAFASAGAAAPQAAVTSMVAAVGDRSCDAAPISSADAAELVRFGLDTIVRHAPSTLVVTSIRGRAEATVQPAFVTLASSRHGQISQERDLKRQLAAVKLGPLVQALTRSPDERCGTDVIGAIQALRDFDAGGSDGPVAVPMMIVLESN